MSYIPQGLPGNGAEYTAQKSIAATKPTEKMAPHNDPLDTQSAQGVQVVLQVPSSSSLTYSSSTGVPQQAEEWVADALSDQMRANLARTPITRNPFENLTHMLFSQIAAGADNVEQSLSRFRTYHKAGSYIDHWVGGVASGSKQMPSKSLGFTLTTRTGTSVRFGLTKKEGYAGVVKENSLSAKVRVNGALTDAERLALGDMADLMERLAKEFMNTGKVSLRHLQGFDSSLFADLKLDFFNGSDQYSLRLNETDQERSLNINWNGNRVALTLDLKGNIIVNSEAKAQALMHYLDLIRESVNKSQGSEDVVKFMVDAFSTLHRLNEFDSRVGTQAKGELPDNALLTGLQDFSATFTSKYTQPNDHSEKFFERQGFTLELGQTTQIKGQLPIELIVDQKQHYRLSASYYRPLWMLEFPDFDTQSYQYIEIEEQSTRRTVQHFEMGQWINAVQSEESSYQHRLTEYRLGELTLQETKEDAWEKWLFLTQEVQQKNDQKAYLTLLDSLLITAPTKRSRV